MRMEPGDIPRKFILRVDLVAKSLQRLGKTVNENEKHLAIVSGLRQVHEARQRMLERGDDELTRKHIEKFIINQCERLQEEKSEGGATALAVRVKDTNDICQLCHKQATTLCPPVQELSEFQRASALQVEWAVL